MDFEVHEILGVKITNIRSNELNHEIETVIRNGAKELITNVNIHAMNLANKDPSFKKILNSAFINFCDGEGVRLGARVFNKNISEKITYNKWVWDLASFSVDNDLSWFIVGSSNDVIREANNKLKLKYPKLNLKGYHHGYLQDPVINENLIKKISESKPHILLIGMGMPIQEKWLENNYNKLNFNVALTGGAVFEYVAETARMTPNIFYKLKLEWFYRFLQEPKRLFRRYFIGNPLFFFRILYYRFFNVS